MNDENPDRKQNADKIADNDSISARDQLPGQQAVFSSSEEKKPPATLSLSDKITRLTEVNHQLKRKIFDLYTIFEISRNFNAVLRFESLLDSFILTCLAQVGASKAAIFLKEESQSDKIVIARGKGSGHFPDPKVCFDVNSELAVFLAKLNRPVVTGELFGDLLDETEKKILTLFHPGLVVPLIYQTRLSGILLISDKLSSRDFGLNDVEFLSILASQIAVAIENARLYEAEKAATQHLRAAQQQLIDTERRVALGEMSARVAHEVNNPLSIIKNYLLLVRRAIGRNVEAGNYIDIVGQEIDRIANIVRQLLDFHRPDKDVFEVVNIIDVMNDVLVLMDRQLDKLGIELIREFDDRCPAFEGSSENIKQVILNILINASDAMNTGGKLMISIKGETERIIIQFCDTGPGIPPEVIPRIFEPFFTTKQPGHGTGLGLAVCYGIIKRHDGTITYRNTDKGGCFEIILPAVGYRKDNG
jgi:signal transduction histidine kinase